MKCSDCGQKSSCRRHRWESKNTTKNAKLFLYLRSVLWHLSPPEISSGVFFEPVPSSHVRPTSKPPAEPHQGLANSRLDTGMRTAAIGSIGPCQLPAVHRSRPESVAETKLNGPPEGTSIAETRWTAAHCEIIRRKIQFTKCDGGKALRGDVEVCTKISRYQLGVVQSF